MDAATADQASPAHRRPPLGSGGVSCAFLRRTFRHGLPSGFGIAEVGVWYGDTSIEFAKLLPKDGFLHLFDFEPIVQRAKQRLTNEGYTRTSAFGCSTKSGTPTIGP